jgi:hypothetical protein
MAKWSPAIPTLRSIVDLFEAKINRYRRYKAHLPPSEEADIHKLMNFLVENGIFEQKPTRAIPRVKDYVIDGNHILAEKNWLSDWASKRKAERKDTEDFDVAPEVASASQRYHRREGDETDSTEGSTDSSDN